MLPRQRLQKQLPKKIEKTGCKMRIKRDTTNGKMTGYEDNGQCAKEIKALRDKGDLEED